MRLRLLPLALVALTAAACERSPQKVPPSLDKPPSTKSAMWSMAQASGTLADLLSRSTAPTPDELAQANRLLDDIGRTVDGLTADPASKAHPLLGPGLPGFKADVDAAKAGLGKAPPDVEPAKRLAASCRQCHAVAALPVSAGTRLAARD